MTGAAFGMAGGKILNNIGRKAEWQGGEMYN